MTTARVSQVADEATVEQGIERMGRVAIATQGVLYVVVGLLASRVAAGDRSAQPSQRGALATVAHQPFGRGLLVVLALGLAAYAIWRAVLAVRGAPGDDDSKSVARRAANAGRAVLYLSLTAAALRLLTRPEPGGAGSGGQSSGGSGDKAEQSTSTVLSWPAGPLLVILAGLAVIGTGVWNGHRAITRSFVDSLDLSRFDARHRRAVEWAGSIGYLARGLSFGLVGWFLVDAGLQHDPSETRGLDEALKELANTSYGPFLLSLLAIGLVVFGMFRVLDASVRRPNELTRA